MSENTSHKPRVVGYLYDAVNSRLVRAVVQVHLGYTMLLKAKADETIEHIPSSDIVISDVTGGGYDVYNAARVHNKPIIMLDGGLLDDARTPDAIIVLKPFKLSELEKAVRKCAESLKPNAPQ
jgi:hypothetical protein